MARGSLSCSCPPQLLNMLDPAGVTELLERHLGLVENGEGLVAMTFHRQDLGEERADVSDPLGRAEPDGDSERLRQRLVDFLNAPLFDAAGVQKSRSNTMQGHGARAHVAEAVVDRKLLLPPDAQGLVEIAAA